MKISRDGANQEPERETPLPAEQEIEEATLPEPPKEVYHAKRQKPEKPPKPKKEKPPRRRREPEPEEEGEEEVRRHHFPVGLLVLVLVLALLGFGVMKGMEFYHELDGSGDLGAETTVSVAQGESVAEIAQQLKSSGVIQYDWLFKQYAKYSGKAGDLQYGDFTLRSGMPYNEILKALSVQQVHRKTVSITFPEGSTCFAIAAKMEENNLCTAKDFLACANGADGSDFSQYAFWTQIPENENRAMKCEGYLFPDTYEFYTDDTVYNLVNTFYKQFDAKTAGLMDTITSKGTTLNDVVILASFIQEEAGLPAEDYKVSAVFHNRLESTDPLWAEHKLESNASSYIQSDTDNNYVYNWLAPYYGGWDAIPENIRTAYDTYATAGLTPGAISNPGYDAIDAALNPDADFMAEGYYFFVTGNPNGEYPGQYFYAKTADEHAANVQKAGWG